MTSNDILERLKELGTAQNRKVWAQHGAPESHLGVSTADIKKIEKEIKRCYKTDLPGKHQLAMDLYDTGVCDAQILATLTADPLQLSQSRANAMIKDVSFYLISNYLGGLFAQTSYALSLMEKEMSSKKEYTQHNGYDMLTTILKNRSPQVTKIQCQKYLKQIEQNIHISPNRVKSAMNWALIAMGVYEKNMQQNVMAAAKRIGKVHVDHGLTNCKTPNAIEYIEKSLKYRKKPKKS